MVLKRSLQKRIDKLSNALVIQEDLYSQVSENRDHWKEQVRRHVIANKVVENKLRDEQELCNMLAEFLNLVLNNYSKLTPNDIKNGKHLMKMYKEARHAK